MTRIVIELPDQHKDLATALESVAALVIATEDRKQLVHVFSPGPGSKIRKEGAGPLLTKVENLHLDPSSLRLRLKPNDPVYGDRRVYPHAAPRGPFDPSCLKRAGWRREYFARPGPTIYKERSVQYCRQQRSVLTAFGVLRSAPVDGIRGGLIDGHGACAVERSRCSVAS